MVWEAGLGTIEDCDIFANASVGVEIQEKGDPTIRNCRINRNEFNAIWVKKDSSVTVEDSDLRNNKQAGWQIDEGAGTIRRKNNKE